jgi:L-ascorbate metabolism protein UlaG (beta-lactamase superfamily)
LEESVKRPVIIAAFLVVCVVATATADDNTISTDKGPVTIHPIQHATFVMQWNEKTIVVDPVGGGSPFQEFGTADLILITDIHGDHLSVETVALVAKPETMVVCPAAVAEKFTDVDRDRLTVLANGESVDWGGASIQSIAAYNLTPERQNFHAKGRGNGYVLTLGGTRVYISGDTEDVPEMRALEGIDAAFVCMNLPYTMDVPAAADAVLEFKPQVVFPYHYRGKGGMSDVDEFQALVAKDPKIEVRRLEWY